LYNTRSKTTIFESGSKSGDGARSFLTAQIEAEIAELLDQSTQDLRVAWRQLRRTGPPLGISRDLLIRAIANQLQERIHGEASRVLRRRLQNLAGEFEKGRVSFDPAIVPKIVARTRPQRIRSLGWVCI
jgi:hypothetical protein